MAGAIGAVLFTIPTVAAIIAAVSTGCEIKIVKKDGEEININEMTSEKFDDLKSVFKDKKEMDENADAEVDSSDAEAEASPVFEEDIFEDETAK